MASKNTTTTVALVLALNLIFFSLVSACEDCPKPDFAPNFGVRTNTCPIDTLKLNVCASLLGGVAGAVIGTAPSSPCCSLIGGLVDLDAAVCLCTAIRAQILGINLNIPLSLNLILNACGKRVPQDFSCA